MKNLLYLFIIVLFFSCTTKKSVQKSNIDQKIEQINDISDTKVSQIESKKTIIDQSKANTKLVVKTTNYDTSKPIDPSSGKPPISSETITTQEDYTNNDVNTKIDTNKKDQSSHEDKSKANANTKEENKVVETSKPINWKLYIYTFLFVAIATIILYYRNKIKDIFSKIKVLFGFPS